MGEPVTNVERLRAVVRNENRKQAESIPKTKWLVIVTFMRGGKYPDKPIAKVVECDSYWTATQRGVVEAKKSLPPRTKVDEFSVRVKRYKDA
jgi:hypothetical protein